MQVLFFPYFPNNPYQPNLMNALAEKGYQVEGVKDISLFTLARTAKGHDIYHLHWTHPYLVANKLWKAIIKAGLFFTILVSLKIRGRRLVWTVHNLGDHEKRQQKFEVFAHRLLARLCDKIIVHSKFAKKKVIEKYQIPTTSDRVKVIPHGNYLGNYPNTLTQDEARKALELPEESTVFLFLGQIRPYKGVPELVDAFTRIADDSKVLILAGNPADKETHDELTKQVGETKSVHYIPGFVPEEKIQEYMQAADVVVFPFRDILTSGSILLAMSFGKAIIVPALESLEEIIEVCGSITFSPDLDDDLERSIKNAFTADLQELGVRNLKAAELLSWSTIAEKTIDAYSNPQKAPQKDYINQ